MTVAIHSTTDLWNNGATLFEAIKMDVTDSGSQADSRLLHLLVGGSSKFLVDKSGHILSGVSTAESVDGSGVRAEIAVDTGADFGIRINEYGNNAFGSELIFTRTRAGSARTHTVLQSGDSLGGLMWYGSGGSGYHRIARLRVEVDGTPGVNDMPGRMLFFTTPDGSATLAERMRIASDGDVFIGTASNNGRLFIGQSQTENVGPNTTNMFNINYANPNSLWAIATHAYGNTNLGPAWAASHSRSATVGSHAAVQDGDQLLRILAYGSDGTNFQPAAAIRIAVDGSVSPGDLPTRMTFHTTQDDGAGFLVERMRIDNAGRINIGAGGNGILVAGTIPQFSVVADVNSVWQSHIHGFGAHAFGTTLITTKTRNSSAGSHTIVQNNDELFGLIVDGSDGTNYQHSAVISVEVDGTPGTNDMPGRILFKTSSDGSASPAERMRIDKNGSINIGGSGPSFTPGAVTPHLVVNGTDFTGSMIGAARFSNDTFAPSVHFGKSRSGTIGSHGVVTVGDTLGAIDFYGSDGAFWVYGAQIDVRVDGSVSSGVIPTSINFAVKGTGGEDRGYSMKIRSNGQVIIADNGGSSGVMGGSPTRLEVTADGSTDYITRFHTVGNHVFGAWNVFTKSRSTSPTGHVIVSPDDQVMVLESNVSDGIQYRTIARINTEVDGTPGASDTPGRIRFLTSADGTSSPLERMRIDNQGKVIIGGTANDIFWSASNAPVFQVLGTGTNTSGGAFARYSNDASGPRIFIGKSRGTTLGSRSVVQSGDSLGFFNFQGTDGTDFVEGAVIEALVDGTPGTNDMPTRIAFKTTPDGSGGASERMRIDNAGKIIIGGVASQFSSRFQQLGTSSGTSSYVQASFSTSDPGPTHFFIRSRGASIGTHAVVNNGDMIGRIAFLADDGTSYLDAGQITVYCDGTPGTNDMPGRMTFATTPDGGTSAIDRMKIDSAGTTHIADYAVIGSDLSIANNWNGFPAALFVYGNPQNVWNTVFTSVGNHLFGPTFNFVKTRSTNPLTSTAVQSGDQVMDITAHAADGTTWRTLAQLTIEVDGTPGTNMPGRYVFRTRSTSDSSPIERLRINSAGDAIFRPTISAPSGGSTSARLLFGTASDFGIYYGLGVPTVSAGRGSIYLRTDGSSTSTRMYVNTDGGTTWTNVTTAA